jgi:hypothetical protein
MFYRNIEIFKKQHKIVVKICCFEKLFSVVKHFKIIKNIFKNEMNSNFY